MVCRDPVPLCNMKGPGSGASKGLAAPPWWEFGHYCICLFPRRGLGPRGVDCVAWGGGGAAIKMYNAPVSSQRAKPGRPVCRPHCADGSESRAVRCSC